MHRNTFVDAPRLLDATLALRSEPRVRFAGQITGTEGYLEAAAAGCSPPLNTCAALAGEPPLVLPADHRVRRAGRLCDRPGHAALPADARELRPRAAARDRVRGKRERYAAYASARTRDLLAWLAAEPCLPLARYPR